MLKRLAWMALFACAPLYAAPHLDDQRLQQLANDPFWLSLGHYEAGKVSGWRSYVSDKKFFLAADGAHHPDAELKATVDALYAPASLGEKHAQCVYPARTRWLKDRLQLTDLPAVGCNEFKQWFKDVAPHSAVMIFPAAYLNSPSSMFGHTLLRIDQADVQSNNTALLSYAINFGAYIEGSDNSILYAWKGLMGGYPSATGYRFEAHKTGLKERITTNDSLPLGADLNPSAYAYEKHIDATARVKRDKQAMTTEKCFEDYDLYLNYLRGGPGFGDPLDRDPAAIANDLNHGFLLPEYARKVYGAVLLQNEKGVWSVDAEKTKTRRAEIRKERLRRAVPVKTWMRDERERIVTKHASLPVRHMYATSFGLSKKFYAEFKKFWDLPADWELTEDELGVPSYGSRYRMDLSKLPTCIRWSWWKNEAREGGGMSPPPTKRGDE